MHPPKIITKLEELPDTLWFPQKGSRNITDLYRGQPVAESISPRDLNRDKLLNLLEELPDKTLLYERLPGGGNGASLDHWQQIEIRLQQPESEQIIDFEEQPHTSRRIYFQNMAKSPATIDFHYINEERIRENAAQDAGSQLAQQIAVIEKDAAGVAEKIFNALGGKLDRQDIGNVLTALIDQSLTAGQVYKALLQKLVQGRAVIGCEAIDPTEITSSTAQDTELVSTVAEKKTAHKQEGTAEERRQAKIASIHKKLRAIQKNHAHKREETGEEQQQNKRAAVQPVIDRLSEMSFQQSEVLIYGDFLINKDEQGNFTLSCEHPLSRYIGKPIRIITMGIQNLSSIYAAEYERSKGKCMSLNIYGQVIQRLNLDKDTHDIIINPYAIY